MSKLGRSRRARPSSVVRSAASRVRFRRRYKRRDLWAPLAAREKVRDRRARSAEAREERLTKDRAAARRRKKRRRVRERTPPLPTVAPPRAPASVVVRRPPPPPKPADVDAALGRYEIDDAFADAPALETTLGESSVAFCARAGGAAADEVLGARRSTGTRIWPGSNVLLQSFLAARISFLRGINRGDAAAATWMFREVGSRRHAELTARASRDITHRRSLRGYSADVPRRRRGHDADSPLRRVARPRPPTGGRESP